MQTEELARLSVFSGLQADQLARVCPLLRWLRFGAGQTVFAAGDPANRFYVVISGEISIRYHPYDGGCVEVATVRSDGAFGWSAILKRAQYTATAVCRTDVEALAIHTNDLHRVMSADVALGDRLLENLGQIAANRAEGLGRQVIRLLQSDDSSR
jgi:CRP-like cAMP-binding protein